MKTVLLLICAFIGIIWFINSKTNDNTAKLKAEKHQLNSIADLPSNITAEPGIFPAALKDTAGNNKVVTNLKNQFNFKKDEFNGNTWVHNKSEPKYRNANGLYCYFSEQEGLASNLRFVIQYYADDWLFVTNYRFVIDGKPYSLTPGEVKRDHDGGKVWEWSDNAVRGNDEELLQALANAKTAKMRYEGDKYYKEKAITSAQLKSIKSSLDLYKAMGGN